MIEKAKAKFLSLKAEFKEITFPTKKEMLSSLVIVLIGVTMLVGIVILADYIGDYGLAQVFSFKAKN